MQRIPRFRTNAGVLLLAVGAAACSDEGPTALAACEWAAVLPADAVGNVTAEALGYALQDAAVRVDAVATETGQGARLAAGLLSLTPLESAGECNALQHVRQLLAAQPDNPETAPDLAAIELTLDLVETWLATRP